MARMRRARAALAAGTVLGIGTLVTLAAWTDEEHVTGTFSAAGFDLEGAVSETAGEPDFTQHSTPETAGLLEFDVDATNLSPGDVVRAPMAIRLAAGTTLDATVRLSSTLTGTTSGLSYSLTVGEDWGCAAPVRSVVIPGGTALNPLPGIPIPTLSAGTGEDPGAANYLCLTVTAGTGLTTGQTGSVTFSFTATSVAP